MELDGSVAVVTGASSGIGEATARRLAAEGATVVAVARRGERLEALAAEQPRIRAHLADVTVDAEVDALAERVRGELGACHVLVNNAGAPFAQRFRVSDDRAHVEAAMDLNFLGAVRCMAAFADLLFASAPARVINVASVAGKIGVARPAYVAAKFALVGFSEAVAVDWHAQGVRVCQLNPGLVATEGFPHDDLRGNPLLRQVIVGPERVAAAVVRAARSGAHERTVPGWYRPLVLLRHVAGAGVRAALRRLPQ